MNKSEQIQNCRLQFFANNSGNKNCNLIEKNGKFIVQQRSILFENIYRVCSFLLLFDYGFVLGFTIRFFHIREMYFYEFVYEYAFSLKNI